MQRTPLYEQHVALGAKMVEFYGWQMPLHYGSQIKEHEAVRQHAGVFDVSHMTVVDILGTGGRQFLLNLLANNIDSLKPGKAMYSCMLNQHGNILDDLIVYCRTPDNYRLILNAATRENDLKWLQEKAQGFSVGLQERSELGMFAVQGPKASEILLEVLNDAQMDAVSTLTDFECVDVGDCFFAATGYTGEKGFEVVMPHDMLPTVWQQLIDKGVTPCGLGSRDSLRLEAGMMLYGQDMDDSTTPYDVSLGWTVKLEPSDRDFVGRGALETQKSHGLKTKMVGLILEEKGMMRPGQTLSCGEESGIITSATFSPVLKKSIAFAKVPKSIKETCTVDIRGKAYPVRVTKPRFVSRGEVIV